MHEILFSPLQIPVFKGAASPFVVEGSLSQARHHHGNDGLGDVPDVSPVAPDPSLIQLQGAVQALLELTNEHPGKKSQKVYFQPGSKESESNLNLKI